MKSPLSLLIILLFFSCNQNKEKETILVKPIKENILNTFKYEDVARYTMASIMGQSSKIISVFKKDNLYYVSYIRKSDKTKFDYKIKFNGNNIIWSSIDGRWRDSQYDEKISFIENNDTLSIIQTFDDGSKDIQKYKKGD